MAFIEAMFLKVLTKHARDLIVERYQSGETFIMEPSSIIGEKGLILPRTECLSKTDERASGKRNREDAKRPPASSPCV